MPNVREGESQDDYMDRCMGDTQMNREFPNPQQRAAVCNSYFEDKKGMNVESAEYQGKKVTLNKPFRTSGGKKKFAVYVQNSSGRVVIVRFGDPNMSIKRDDPKRRKAFRDRHNCSDAKDKTTPRYWSCRMWERSKTVTELTSSEEDEKDYPLWFDVWSETEGEVFEGFEEIIEASHDDEEKPCCSSCADNIEAKQIRKDVFDNPAEAQIRAKEIGCSGVHSHQENGETYFMPCEQHEDYERIVEKETVDKMSSYHDDEEEKMASEEGACPIGEELVDGICKPVNVTMEATLDNVQVKLEASTGKTYLEITGIAFHEGYNKNKWALTKSGAKHAVEQMKGADLTLNHPKAKEIGFERNTDGGVNEANVGIVLNASFNDISREKYEVRYTAEVHREELFEALESGMWLKEDYGVSIGGYGVPMAMAEEGMLFDTNFTFDHLAIVYKPAYQRANIETVRKTEAKHHEEEKMTASENVEALQYGRPSKNDPRKTPAKPDERRKGSKKNKPDSASKPNKSIQVSEETRSKLRNMMTEHNKKGKGSKASMGALLSVFRRGAGAFSTSHAPNMTRTGWGIARAKAFLYLLRNGRPSNPNYKQDNDLLPKGHPRAKKTASSTDMFKYQPNASTNQPKTERNNMSEEVIENIEAQDELESLKAELVLARAELEEMKALEASKMEEERLSLVAEATELGLKGHDDLSTETLTSIIASWKATHKEAVVEMKPVEVSETVEASVSETPQSPTPVVANFLNGRKVETPQDIYARCWNAWASAYNKTLSGSEMQDKRIRAPSFEEL